MTLSSQLSLFNTIMASGTILVFVVSIIYKFFPIIRTHITDKMLRGLLICASLGVLGAPLMYQYYFGFPACTLCWYQRIFMWPIAFMILGTSLWRDQAGRRYALSAIRWLAPAGLFFSVWHYISQFGLTTTAAACGAVGQSLSCDGIDVIIWGFVTIPFMAGLGFIGLFLLLNSVSK